MFRRRLATSDFLLTGAYTQPFWVLMGGWTVNSFSSENQTSSTLSRHRIAALDSLLTIRVRRRQLRLLASENVQSLILLNARLTELCDMPVTFSILRWLLIVSGLSFWLQSAQKHAKYSVGFGQIVQGVHWRLLVQLTQFCQFFVRDRCDDILNNFV